MRLTFAVLLLAFLAATAPTVANDPVLECNPCLVFAATAPTAPTVANDPVLECNPCPWVR